MMWERERERLRLDYRCKLMCKVKTCLRRKAMGQVSLLPIKGGPQTQSKLIIIYYSLSKWRFYFPLDDQIGSPPPTHTTMLTIITCGMTYKVCAHYSTHSLNTRWLMSVLRYTLNHTPSNTNVHLRRARISFHIGCFAHQIQVEM